MKINRIIVSLPLACGMLVLAFLAGWKLHQKHLEGQPGRVQMVVVERVVEIPGREIRVPVRPVQRTDNRRVLEDSLLVLMKETKRLDSLARRALSAYEAVFEDTVSVSDSLGSFSFRAVHVVTIDHLLSQALLQTTYHDVKLRTVAIKEEKVISEVTPWDILLSPYTLLVVTVAFIAGFLTGS